MTNNLPSSVPVLVIGAGVHGLSTAWHLAQQGESVLVLDKTGVAAGASGIACGVIRNNYFQPAMSELMAACVEVWESDAEMLHYHGNGYIALGPPTQESDLTEVYERQRRIGYPSELHIGEEQVTTHMRSLYPDWRATGITACLHEQAGGYAFNRESMFGLADKARAAGAQIITGVEVTGFLFDGGDTVTAVHTSQGTIAVEQVVVAVGPWIASIWSQLGLPDHLDVRQPDGTVAADVDLLVSPGGRGRRRSGDVCDRGRTPVRSDPHRQQPAAARRRRAADHRRAVGCLFQARPLECAGRGRAAAARERVRHRPLPDRNCRSRLPGHVVRGPFSHP